MNNTAGIFPLLCIFSALFGYFILNAAGFSFWFKFLLTLAVAILLSAILVLLEYLDKINYGIIMGR